MSSQAFPAPTRVLLVAARRYLGRDGPSPPAADVGALPEWAQRHGLLGLAARALDAADARVDRAVRDDLAMRLRLNAASALQHQSDLPTILDALNREHVDAVVFKGLPFSSWVYGDPAFRRCIDIDLLAARDARDRAAAVLDALGYRCRVTPRAADVVYRGARCWPFEHRTRARVDLHWQVLGRRFPPALGAETILRESIERRFGAVDLRVPTPDHATVIALAHTAKHVWYSLESVLSIAMLTMRPDVDWAAVHALARAGGVDYAAAAGLRLAADLLGAAVPEPFASLVDSAAARRAAGYGLAALALPPHVFPDGAAESRAHRAWMRERRARIRYEVLRAAEPTYAEWAMVRLPRPLTSLYVPLRIARLAVRGFRV